MNKLHGKGRYMFGPTPEPHVPWPLAARCWLSSVRIMVDVHTFKCQLKAFAQLNAHLVRMMCVHSNAIYLMPAMSWIFYFICNALKFNYFSMFWVERIGLNTEYFHQICIVRTMINTDHIHFKLYSFQFLPPHDITNAHMFWQLFSYKLSPISCTIRNLWVTLSDAGFHHESWTSSRI